MAKWNLIARGTITKTAVTACRLSQAALLTLVLASCSGRRVNGDVPVTEDPISKDKKIENLTSALSRAQSRIEELDAKLAALSDKVDSTRMTVDNMSGNKPIKTVAVGEAAKNPEDAEHESGHGQHRAEISKEGLDSPAAHSENSKISARMDASTSEFMKAMTLFKTGKYADAELAFNHFTEKYPEHVLAGSAQFYAGESYLHMGEYKLAINEYGKVISSFSSSPRVASAMVRLAHCYEQVGNTGEATRTMALARDLFEGNPALDMTPTSKPTKKADLDASPIEPKHEANKQPHAQAHEDKEVDDLEKVK